MTKINPLEKIKKRNGNLVKYRFERIVNAIYRALIASNKKPLEENLELAKKLAKQVEDRLTKIFSDSGRYPSVEDIQDLVEAVLLENKLFKVVQNYVGYRQQRRLIREEKKHILNKDTLDPIEKRFSLTAIQILAARYLIRDKNGDIIEGVAHLFGRSAVVATLPEFIYDKKVAKKPKKGPFLNFPTKKAGIFDFKTKPKDKEIRAFIEKITPKVKQMPTKLSDIHSGYTLGRFPITYAHLERLAMLFDEAQQHGWTKISWKKFMDLLSKGYFEKYAPLAEDYYKMMVNQEFLPNSPTLMNAGYRLGQLSACFVLDMEDDLLSILTTNTHVGIIFQSGGGVGINYGKLRPKGDIVASTYGTASGPLSFMEIVNTTTEVIKQGGKRRGANMGVLDVYHPDIEEFITIKEDLQKLTNFNISVGMWQIFWDSLKHKKPMPLINPRNKEVTKHIDPDHLINRIAFSAHKSAEPGVIFFDKINEFNVLKNALGNVRATNPCGEQPLYAYESCNLGSINLAKCVKQGKDGKPQFDWKKYYRLIKLATRFLDSIVDINRYPLPIIRYRTRSTRKIGLGIMGLADAFYKLGIPYNSKEAYELMSKLAEALTYYSMKESVNLAEEKGSFPLFKKSDYVKGEVPVKGYYDNEPKHYDWKALIEEIKKRGIRNSMTTTIAPTGSIAMIADTSTGLEPQFSLAYRKNIAIGSFLMTDPVFDEYLFLVRRDSGKLKKMVANNRGMLAGLHEYFSKEERARFITAQEIHWLDHLVAQAKWQRWISASISKTINMHEEVSVNDIKHAYLLGHELGAKGLTVYREGSRFGVIQMEGEQPRQQPKPSTYALLEVEKVLNNPASIYAFRETYRRELLELIGASEKTAQQPPQQQPQLTTLQNTATNAQGNKNSKEAAPDEENGKCPECGGELVMESGCSKCIQCGWSACTVS